MIWKVIPADYLVYDAVIDEIGRYGLWKYRIKMDIFRLFTIVILSCGDIVVNMDFLFYDF